MGFQVLSAAAVGLKLDHPDAHLSVTKFLGEVRQISILLSYSTLELQVLNSQLETRR